MSRIKIGDSEEAVFNILGEPDSIFETEKHLSITAGKSSEPINRKVSSGKSTWSYMQDGGWGPPIRVINICFESYKVVAIQSYDF